MRSVTQRMVTGIVAFELAVEKAKICAGRILRMKVMGSRPEKTLRGTRELRFKGQQYLVSFALPNLYFHATAAYAILRHCGLPIGKRDFLGMT
jgi:hypothetical protein